MELLSKRIAGKLSNEPESKELYQYAIYIILSSLLHLVTLVIIGAFLGLVYESILMYFSFAVIRRFAGGFHASTPIRCYVFSVVLIVLCLLLQKSFLINPSVLQIILLLIVEIVCVILIFRFAPLENKNNPLTQKEKIKYGLIARNNTIFLLGSSILLLIFMRAYFYSVVLGIMMSTFVLLMQIVHDKIIKFSRR